MAGNSGAIRAGRAFVEIFADDSRLVRGLRSTQRKLRAFGSMVSRLGLGLAAGAASFAAPFWSMVTAAGDAGEIVSRFGAVFGSEMEAAGRFADDLADRVGRSGTEIRDSMSAFQGFALGLEFDPAAARGMSEALAELAIDFASFNNMSDAEASERFISALSGSSEVVAMYGINLKQAALDQELLAMGIAGGAVKAGEQQKALARLNIIMRSMTAQGAVGDATRTAASFANQLKRLKSLAYDASVAVGRSLIPVLEPVVTLLGTAAGAVARLATRNAELFQRIARVVAVVAVTGAGLLALGLAVNVAGFAFGGLAKLLVLTGRGFAFFARMAGVGARAVMAVVRVLGMGVGVIVQLMGKVLLAAVQGLIALVTGGFSAMVAAIGAVATPLGLIGIALAGILAVGIMASGVLGTLWDRMKQQLAGLAETAVAAFGGIRDALLAGDLKGAAEIAWLGMQLEFQRGAAALNDVWQQAKTFFLDVWSEASGSLARLFINAFASVRAAWVETATAMQQVWLAAVGAMRQAIISLATIAGKAQISFQEQTGAISPETAELARGALDAFSRTAGKVSEADTGQQLAGVEAARMSQLAGIEADRAGSIDAQQSAQDAAAAARRKTADESLSGTQGKLAEAQAAFNAALQQAAAGRAALDGDGGDGDGMSLEDKLKAALAGLNGVSAEGGTKVLGSFNAAAARGFGVGSGPEEETAENTKATAEGVKQLIKQQAKAAAAFT